MWIPKDAEEIERAARAGDLSETPSFDAKVALPRPNKNADLATDVAAMSTDGGALLYGVGEDDHGPTMPQPIPLAGVGDRIGQIVATSIAEVPYIDVREYPTAADPAVGYVLVIVPQSARAPHQVTVGGDLRFYGRGAKGNRRLTEVWDVDRQRLLVESIQASGVPERPGAGYVHAFTRPVVPEQEMYDRAAVALGGNQQVRQRLLAVIHDTRLRGKYGPSLEQAPYWNRRGADEWRLATRDESEASNPKHITSLSELRINIDGRGHLFVGRATDTALNDAHPLIVEVVIAGNFEAFLAVMGLLYTSAGYYGHVDLGVALTGIEGAGSAARSKDLLAPDFAYGAPTFTRTARVATLELNEPHVVTHRLLRHFYQATTGIDDYNPFDDANA
jgi:hypothetical protein